MYVTMNRFKVTPGREKEFEEVWKTRARAIDGVPGFLDLKVLRPHEGCEEYISLVTWRTRDDFVNWTKSDAFKEGHRRSVPGLIAGHPKLENFEVFESGPQR